MDPIGSITNPYTPASDFELRVGRIALECLGFTQAQLTSEEHSTRRDWLLTHPIKAEILLNEAGLSPEEMLTLPEEMFQIFVENPRDRAVLQFARFDIHDPQIAKLFGTPLGKTLLSDLAKLHGASQLLCSGIATPMQLLEPGYLDNMLYWIPDELLYHSELPRKLANIGLTVENLIEWMSGPYYKDLAARPLKARPFLGQTVPSSPQEDEDQVRKSETEAWKRRSLVLDRLLLLLNKSKVNDWFCAFLRAGHSWRTLLGLELTKHCCLSYFYQLAKYPADAFLNCAFFKLFSDDPVAAAAMLPAETSLSLVKHSSICAEWAPHLGELSKEWLRSFLKEEVSHSGAIDDLFKLERHKAMLALQAYHHLTQRGISFQTLATLDLKVWLVAAALPACCEGLLALCRANIDPSLLLNQWSRDPQIESILERAPQLIRLLQDSQSPAALLPAVLLQGFSAQSALMLLNQIEVTLSIASYLPLLSKFALEEEVAAVLENPDHAKLLFQCLTLPNLDNFPYEAWRTFPLNSRLLILQHAPAFLQLTAMSHDLIKDIFYLNSPAKLALILAYPYGCIGFTRLCPLEQWGSGALSQLLHNMPIAELQTMLQTRHALHSSQQQREVREEASRSWSSSSSRG